MTADTVLAVFSFVVFCKVVNAVKTDEGFDPIKKQVNIFMSIFLSFVVLRYSGFIYLQGEWIKRNLIQRETDLIK